MNKNEVHWLIKFPISGLLRLGEASFALENGLECGKTREVRLDKGIFALVNPRTCQKGL